MTGSPDAAAAPRPARRRAALSEADLAIFERVKSQAETLQRQYADLRLAAPRLMTEANTFLTAARAASTELAKYQLTLTVPPK